MNRTAKLFWLLVAGQVVFLATWAGYHEYIRQHATVILLKGRPLDPQDLLRGDYLTMSYDIQNVTVGDAATPSGTGAIVGKDAWVLLEKRDGYHVAVKASRERFMPGPGQLLVRGTFGYGVRTGTGSARVDYGIERYFVPEGKGSPRFTKLEAEVSVSPAHRLYIRRVLLDGKAYP
jgi:uncharacterized membrane-anchored protein